MTRQLDSDKMAAAKLWLISAPLAPGPETPRDLPYLAHALYAMVPVACADVPRMSCDERWRLYVNPAWLATTEVPSVARELAHMVWHLLSDHTERARDQHVDATTSGAWTRAADATVEQLLADGELCPPELLAPGDLGLPPNRSAEEYFALIARLPVREHETPDSRPEQPLNPSEGCGSGCDGVRREHELPPDLDLGEVTSEEAREIRRRVAVDYREHSITRGDRPGDAWRWATQILEPRIAWEQLLSGAVRRAAGWASGRTDYTWSRPSRRQSCTPRVLLPGMRRPLPQVAMVIDTSGSVDDLLLGQALGEVDGALRAIGVGDGSVTIYSCDAAVHTVRRIRRARDALLAGGGGTDMRIGIAATEDQRPRPDLVVVFTDGATPWPEQPPPGSVVVVALLGRSRQHLPPTPAWATRVECVAS